MDLRILRSQRIADLSSFWNRILDFGCLEVRIVDHLTFSLICIRCHAVEKMTRNSDALINLSVTGP